jgi:hypothetical protein
MLVENSVNKGDAIPETGRRQILMEKASEPYGMAGLLLTVFATTRESHGRVLPFVAGPPTVNVPS